MSVISLDSPEGKRIAAKRRLDAAIGRLAEANKREEPLHEVLLDVDEARAALADLEEPRVDSLEDLWQPIGQWAPLTTAPPPRQWLLRRPDPETNGQTSVGVLPLSKCGLFVGDGGVGKSWALLELAVCVATGRRWLDFFDVPTVGHVLLAMGEEDRDELHRRLYSIARAMRLTEAQEQLAHERIVALPLAGKPTALIQSERGQTVETTFLRDLRGRLEAGEGWRLVVIDPLSRFAGADTEKDNAAATRFVQAVESLVEVPGNPTVLVSHHTRKPPTDPARKGTGASAANARGASALVAGFRWSAEIERISDGAARFTVTKSNYAPHGLPVDLVRDPGDGYLRVATAEERTRAEDDAERQRSKVVDAKRRKLQDAICAELAVRPDQPKVALRTSVGGRRDDVYVAVDDLLRARRIVLSSRHGYSLASGAAEAAQ